jgi:hypothetical protein
MITLRACTRCGRRGARSRGGRRYDHIVTEAEARAALPALLTPEERAGARNDRDRLVLQAELFRARFGG